MLDKYAVHGWPDSRSSDQTIQKKRQKKLGLHRWGIGPALHEWFTERTDHQEKHPWRIGQEDACWSRSQQRQAHQQGRIVHFDAQTQPLIAACCFHATHTSFSFSKQLILACHAIIAPKFILCLPVHTLDAVCITIDSLLIPESEL